MNCSIAQLAGIEAAAAAAAAAAVDDSVSGTQPRWTGAISLNEIDVASNKWLFVGPVGVDQTQHITIRVFKHE